MIRILKWSVGLLSATVLLFVLWAVLFPKWWMKVVKPIQYDIRQVNMRVMEKEIQLDFQVIITGDYFVDFILDSVAYEVFFDSTKFSEGRAVIGKEFDEGRHDTLYLPLVIDRTALRGKMKSMDTEDQVNLRIRFVNYINLPLAGKTTAVVHVNRAINAPSPPQISVVNVERTFMKLHDAVFMIEFALYNENNYSFEIESMDADIIFTDLFTGHAKSLKSVNVKANDTTFFKAEVDIDDLELVRDGLRVVFRPNKEWPYTIKATLNIRQDDGTPMVMNVFHDSEKQLMGQRKKDK